MKKVGKKLALVLSAAIMAVAFAACSSDSESESENTSNQTVDTGSTETADTGSTETADTGSTETADTGSTETADSGSTGTADTESTETVPEGLVKVNGATVSGAVSGSSVFITGRTIEIPEMYVCDHEVTQKEYETYCAYYSSSHTPSETYGVGDNYPVYDVSWYDAIVYCNLRSMAEGLTPAYSIGEETDPKEWDGIKEISGKYYYGSSSSDSTWNSMTYDTTANGYRLPTEAEWEYIARNCNQASFEYAGSGTIEDVAWYKSNSNSTTHKVKGKDANGLGIYDMSGNVWEWCWDWYRSSITSTTAATGATSGSSRVLRGGCCRTSASSCTVSYRERYSPCGRGSSFGFRVVRSSSN